MASFGFVLISFVLISILSFVLIKINGYIFSKNIDVVKNEYVNLLKEQVKGDVIDIKEYIPYLALKSERSLKNTIKLKCGNMFSLSYFIYSTYKSDSVLAKNIENIVYQALQGATFLGGEGFYGLISHGEFVFGQKNQDKIKLTRPIPVDFQEGFINLQLPNQISNDVACYIKYFSPIASYIAACIPQEDLRQKIQYMVADTIANRNLSMNKNRYIFINDTKGNMVLIYTNVMLNKNRKLWEIAKNKEDEKLIRDVFQKELKAYYTRGGKFIKYMWYEPKLKKYGQKISFICAYKPWGWIIGEGFYEDEVDFAIDRVRNGIKEGISPIIKYLYLYILLLGAGILLFSYILFLYLNTKLRDTFKVFEKSFKEQNRIDESKYSLLELRNIARYINNFIEKFKDYENEFLEALVYAMESKDPYTKGHSQRVARYASLIAKELGLGEEKESELYKAGLLHDIGKIGIPDNILLKPGKLTPTEYKIIQYHPIFSYEIVSQIEQFKPLAKHIRHHHERCDGSGYPDKLKCEQISLETRILAIADVFDAITSKRAYRKQLNAEEAIKIMEKEPLDQEILAKIKDKLMQLYTEEESVEYRTDMIEEVEKIRKELFDIDYITGLKRRRVLIDKTNKFIEEKKPFAIFFIDIKNLSYINYTFSTYIGDKLIIYTAIALSDVIKGCSNCETLSRAYNDAFLFIFKLKSKDYKKECSSMDEFLRNTLKNKVVELFEKDEEIDKTTKRKLYSSIEFHIFYGVYPDEFKNTEDLIYGCMKKKKKHSES
ncbi:cache domain-containing protein [Hippea maritima]|uniref:Metal dependent phosphohydrolase n=1 Tax=Hippea maritima (strain ATCC 700847 / DSM 10411 / MH2) TaxID=760142 RepID=F2LTM5_HIPMA|nr:cache domain-containing protein [Hippea maritima]AEA33350.1 metal dependent phosphohydrolase [Hippea maritima DSM 10411]